MVYNYLAKELDDGVYWDALVLDKRKWREAVESRLKGRAEAKKRNLENQDVDQ